MVRLRRVGLLGAAAAGCLVWSMAAWAQASEVICGVGVFVQDGDSFEIADSLGRVTKIRLHGIDAPEIDQTCIVRRRHHACGEDAAARLLELVMNRAVACTVQGVTFNRIAAACTVNGRDIAEILVREGHAIAYRDFSGRYVAQEEEARRARRGIWQGNMESPRCWRRPRAAGCPCPIQSCIQ